MRCPICKREAAWEGNPYRPFCSERCQLLDLDNWLSERYRIPSPIDSEERPEDASDDRPAGKDKRG